MKMLNKLKRVLFFIMILIGNSAMAQVIQAEYFIDADDNGEGLNTPMLAIDGSLNSAIESVVGNGISLTQGMHTISIRIKDNAGNWGPVFKTVVSIENTLTTNDIHISQAEIFWDETPAEGAGIPMVAFDGNFDNALETLLQNGFALPATPGVHKLGIRVMDINNNWGPVFTTIVSVENVIAVPDIHIAAGEYFWNTDAGEGNNIALLAFDSNFDSAIETILKNSVSIPASAGIYKLGVRVKDFNNNWGPVFSTIVSVEDVLNPRNIKVSLAEYFWDDDDAEGSGTILLAFDGNFNQAIETLFSSNVSQPSAGLHRFGVRVKGHDGSWGPAFSTVVSIEDELTPRNTNIVAGELFWDTDPGQGSGTSLIAFDGNFENAIEAVIKNTTIIPTDAGIHTLNIRVKDATNQWGPVFSTVVSVENLLSPRDLSITLAEAYWDTDPGYGAGIPLLAFDGDFNSAVEQANLGMFTGYLSVGIHKLCVRVQSASGDWSPVYTSAVFVDACSSSPVPTITAGGSTTICEGDSLLLTAEAGYTSYKWMKGSTQLSDTTQAIYVSEAGYYKVIVTDGDNCPGVSVATIVNVIPVYPNISVYGETEFCDGGSVTLDAGNAFDTYEWSNGATTTSINVTLGGAYSVTVTNDGCQRISPIQMITVNPNPAMPTITADGATEFCIGDSVKLTASSASEYLWSTGDTTQEITIYSSGNFTVSAINSYGCSTSSVVQTVTATSSNPDIIVHGSLNICDGDEVILDGGNGYSNYLWSTGETTQMISATTAGTYKVTVTNVACVGESNTVSVSVYPSPISPTITAMTATTFCSGDSVLLVSSVLNNNVWSTGETSNFIVAYSSNNYYVNVYNGFGCYATSNVISVDAIETNSNLSVSGSTNLCEGDSVIIGASVGYDSYVWSNGSTESFVKVFEGGVYNVTITNQSCNIVSDGVTVVVNPNPSDPTISQFGTTTFCQGDTLVLSSSISDSYLWSNGLTSQTINVTNTGSYSVYAYNSFGCSAQSASVDVTVLDNPQPIILYSGNTMFCEGESITLTSSIVDGNLWSPGDTTQAISVIETGNYTVTSFNTNGCYSTSDPLTITVTSINPMIASSGSTAFCQGGNVTLDAGLGFDSYHWSTGQTGQSISAITSGSYLVTVSLNGCERVSDSVVVTVFDLPEVPIITAGSTTHFCDGDSVILSTGSYSSYLWSDGSTNSFATIFDAGCYSVMITDVNGCQRVSACQNIIVDESPNTPIISVNGQYVFCYGDSVTLSSSVEEEYLWSTGDTSRNILVYETGMFNVRVTNSYGCKATSQYSSITVNPAQEIPEISFVGNTILCEGDSITLTSTPSEEYIWSTGELTNSVVIKTGGSYFVEAINFYGCTATSEIFNVSVNPNPATPIVTSSGGTSFCMGDTLVLTSTVSDSYAWSTGDTSRNISVISSGDYFLTVFNSFGCGSKSDTTSVVVYDVPEVPVITQSGDSLMADVINVDYQWFIDGVAWVNATTQDIKAPHKGNYQVVVTNLNGCESESQIVYVITGVDEQSKEKYKISAYPNPFSEFTTISVSLPASIFKYDLHVVNMIGETVIKASNIASETFTIDGTQLPKGFYIFRIISENKELGTGKLIVK